jgi:RNA polymerase sigma-70 factor (ECF subfamily)
VELPQAASTAGAELEEVLRMLQTLPEDIRAALMLRAEQDMSYAEIGAVLGMSEGAARVKVHRARARLAEMRSGTWNK